MENVGAIVWLLVLIGIVYAIVKRPGEMLIIIGALMTFGFLMMAYRPSLFSGDALVGAAISVVVMGLGGVAIRLGRIADALAPRGDASPQPMPWMRKGADSRSAGRETNRPPFKPGERGYYGGHTYEVLSDGQVKGIAGEFRNADEFVQWVKNN